MFMKQILSCKNSENILKSRNLFVRELIFYIVRMQTLQEWNLPRFYNSQHLKQGPRRKR